MVAEGGAVAQLKAFDYYPYPLVGTVYHFSGAVSILDEATIATVNLVLAYVNPLTATNWSRGLSYLSIDYSR